jgi:CheY-like chemotaxis protein
MNPKKILVVDDEADIGKMLKLRLEHEGFHVSVAANGPEAIRVAPEARPDLIIMDIAMPVMGGIETVQVLRNSGATRTTPVIFLTALRNKEDQIQCGDKIGACTVLAKPVDEERLISKIRQEINAFLPPKSKKDGHDQKNIDCR